MMNGNQVPMPDPSRELRFAQKPFDKVAFLPRHAWVQHLDGKLLAVLRTHEVHHPHAALSKQFFHDIIAEHVTRLEQLMASRLLFVALHGESISFSPPCRY